MSDTNLLVSAGSYDGNLVGISVRYDPELEYNPDLEVGDQGFNGYYSKTKYAFKTFEGSIRTMANNGKYLAIGGFEEIIKLYDLHKQLEVGELVDHKGTITQLEFFKNDYLLSSSEDGDIFIWRVKDWSLIYQLRQKKSGSVVDFATHPSGKLCMAMYKSCSFILWDLTKGKLKFKKKVREDFLAIKWDHTGMNYLILCKKSIAVYSILQDKPISIINFDEKLRDFGWISKSSFLSLFNPFIANFKRELEDPSESSQTPEKEVSEEALFVLADTNYAYYVTQYTSENPVIWTLESGLPRHRKLAITPTKLDNLISILDTSGCISFVSAAKIIDNLDKKDSEYSEIESDEGEGESEKGEGESKKDTSLIDFDKQIPMPYRLLTLTVWETEPEPLLHKKPKKVVK